MGTVAGYYALASALANAVTVKIMSERKVIGIGAIVDKNVDTLDDV